jgi:hypothetical protein
MLYHLLIAVVGVVGLVLVWVAVQAIVRRQSPELARHCDVLECKMCGTGGGCLSGPEEYQSCAARGLDAVNRS